MAPVEKFFSEEVIEGVQKYYQHTLDHKMLQGMLELLSDFEDHILAQINITVE